MLCSPRALIISIEISISLILIIRYLPKSSNSQTF